MDWQAVTALTSPDDPSTAALPVGWGQGRTVFGGLVAALMLRACERRVAPTRVVRGVSVTFLAPTAPGPATLRTAALREGRAVSLVGCTLEQQGQVLARLEAAFGVARPTAMGWAGAPVVVPEGGLRLPFLPGLTPEFTQHFHYLYGAGVPFAGAARPELEGRVRLARPVAMDASVLLGLIDAWPAPSLAMLTGPAPASTVTWTVDFFAPALGVPPDAWLPFRSRTLAGDEGYLAIRSELGDASGRLLAASRQLVAEYSGNAHTAYGNG